MIGHPKVTQRAYEQSRDRRQEAVRFAEAAVHNGLGRDTRDLTTKQLMALKAQIERDYLVALMTHAPEQSVTTP